MQCATGSELLSTAYNIFSTHLLFCVFLFSHPKPSSPSDFSLPPHFCAILESWPLFIPALVSYCYSQSACILQFWGVISELKRTSGCTVSYRGLSKTQAWLSQGIHVRGKSEAIFTASHKLRPCTNTEIHQPCYPGLPPALITQLALGTRIALGTAAGIGQRGGQGREGRCGRGRKGQKLLSGAHVLP